MPGSAVVVGAGPNGLAAAITLAHAGVEVTVLEAASTPGGGSRTAELTLPGFQHDVCSSIHPLAVSSPFFNSLPLQSYGLRWANPEIAVAHPFDDADAAVILRSVDATADALGRDADAYRRLMSPIARHWSRLAGGVLGPLQRVPRHPLLLSRFGWNARRSAVGLAESRFEEARTRALFAGLAAHANLPLTARFSASFALVLGGAAHAAGWPAAVGGSQSITDALTRYLCSLGGHIETDRNVESLDKLPQSDAVLFDLTPRQVSRIAGSRLSDGYRKRLDRFRYGPGVFKIDYALEEPIPWRDAACSRTATVHIGGAMEEIVASEAAVAAGQTPQRPFVIVTQPSLFDDTRAPEGRHTAWAYCHVPSGSVEDMTSRIEAQIERFAPGFAARVLARHTMTTASLEAYNQNYVSGDIGGGSYTGLQLFFRPGISLSPYRTSDPRLFICSSSTPPGAGVHGMCGYHAARSALKTLLH